MEFIIFDGSLFDGKVGRSVNHIWKNMLKRLPANLRKKMEHFLEEKKMAEKNQKLQNSALEIKEQKLEKC